MKHDVGAVELRQLHRFRDPAEATATLELRASNPHTIAFYQSNDRPADDPRRATDTRVR